MRRLTALTLLFGVYLLHDVSIIPPTSGFITQQSFNNKLQCEYHDNDDERRKKNVVEKTTTTIIIKKKSSLLPYLVEKCTSTIQRQHYTTTTTTAMVIFLLTLGGLPTLSSARASENVWQLGNGEVRIKEPLTAFQPELPPLNQPRLLGSGGGGAVFSLLPVHSKPINQNEDIVDDINYNIDDSSSEEIVVKISWQRSKDTVQRECTILQYLEQSHANRGLETCLAQVKYPYNSNNINNEQDDRIMIALTPVMNDSAASINDINPKLQRHAIQSIISTLVDMLSANVATTDVQPLISKATGDVLFIDLTEAQIMSKPVSFLDVSLASSFCAEIYSLIPEPLRDIAIEELQQQLKEGSGGMEEEILDVLVNQFGID